MQSEPHARARLLLDQATMESISADDQRWLNGHTEECEECSRYGELSRRAIRALNSFAFELDAAAAFRVENAIRIHANRLASNEFHGRRFFIGAVAAMLLTIAGSIAIWQPAAWVAGRPFCSAFFLCSARGSWATISSSKGNRYDSAERIPPDSNGGEGAGRIHVRGAGGFLVLLLR
jgi:hypothetical protein